MRPGPTFRALLAMTALALGARTAAAQNCQEIGANSSCSVNATTSFTIPLLPYRLTIGSATTAFGTVTSTDFDNTYAQTAGPTITAKANKPWTVSISSAATFFTASNTDLSTPARSTKPLSDLHWDNNSGGSFANAVTNSAVQIGAGNGTAGTVIPLYFRILWNYSLDTPGNYSVSVTFTLTAP